MSDTNKFLSASVGGGHYLADSPPNRIGVRQTPPMSAADNFVSAADFDLADAGGFPVASESVNAQRWIIHTKPISDRFSPGLI